MNANLPMTASLPAVPALKDAALKSYLEKLSEGIRTAYSNLANINPPFTGTVDAKEFGAKADGVTDDTTAIQAAIASLPNSGGVIYFPPGIYKITSTIYIGNASAPTPSSRHNVSLVGTGVGQNWLMGGTYESCTRLVWGGPAGGTMVHANGPISGVQIRNIVLDGNDVAATLYDSYRSFGERLVNVLGRRWNGGFAYKMRANSPTFVSGGGSPVDNVWEQVSCGDPYAAAAAPYSNGLSIGEGDGDVCECTWIRCSFMRQNHDDAEGLRLRYCDHLAFVHCYFVRPDSANTGRAVVIEPYSIYPHNIEFFASPFLGGVWVDGTYPSEDPWIAAMHCWPYYTADGQPAPPAGANGTTFPYHMIRGVTDRGAELGWPYSSVDTVAASGTIAPNTRFTRLTGTTTISTITPKGDLNGAAHVHDLYLRPGSNVSTATGGNINEARTLSAGRWYHLVYDPIVGWNFVD